MNLSDDNKEAARSMEGKTEALRQLEEESKGVKAYYAGDSIARDRGIQLLRDTRDPRNLGVLFRKQYYPMSSALSHLPQAPALWRRSVCLTKDSLSRSG